MGWFILYLVLKIKTKKKMCQVLEKSMMWPTFSSWYHHPLPSFFPPINYRWLHLIWYRILIILLLLTIAKIGCQNKMVWILVICYNQYFSQITSFLWGWFAFLFVPVTQVPPTSVFLFSSSVPSNSVKEILNTKNHNVKMKEGAHIQWIIWMIFKPNILHLSLLRMYLSTLFKVCVVIFSKFCPHPSKRYQINNNKYRKLLRAWKK